MVGLFFYSPDMNRTKKRANIRRRHHWYDEYKQFALKHGLITGYDIIHAESQPFNSRIHILFAIAERRLKQIKEQEELWL